MQAGSSSKSDTPRSIVQSQPSRARMTETLYAASTDGTRIAYDVSGEGPALVLLHGGFVQARSSWRETGYVSRLQGEFRVITVDLRGHGESERPRESSAYQVERLCDDLIAVADASRAGRFSVWGFSLGGTLALHAASRSERIRRAVIAGSYFGPLLSPEQAEANLARLEQAAAAKSRGDLDKLIWVEHQRQFFEQTDLNLVIALNRAMMSWPPVEPRDLKCRALVYAGSLNKPAVTALARMQDEIREAGVEIEIFEGQDHLAEFNSIDVVFPRVLEFLS